MDSQRETRRAAIRQECAKRNVQITPYGNDQVGINHLDSEIPDERTAPNYTDAAKYLKST